jgi:hypothetical protein
MDYHMQAPGSDPADERDNPQYNRRQTQAGQAFSEFDTATMDPNLLSMDHNMFEQPAVHDQFACPTVQHVHSGSWARAPDPQRGSRDANMQQPSVNTAPPFASRQTTIPRREYRSEPSAYIQARVNNQFLGLGFSNGSAVPDPYSGQLVKSISSQFDLPD